MQFSSADLDFVTRTVWGEARGEPPIGQLAVAQVIKTRALWTPAAWWGSSLGAVCQRAFQFSCWRVQDPNYHKLMALHIDDQEYLTILAMVKRVVAGTEADPTKGATTYKVNGTTASWDKAVAGHAPIVVWSHSFWRLTPGGVVWPFLEDNT